MTDNLVKIVDIYIEDGYHVHMLKKYTAKD